MPHLCRWCEFQSRLLFIISLLLKNFLTALYIIILVMDLWSIPPRGTWNYHLITKQNPDWDDNLVWHNHSLVGWGYKIKLGMIEATSQGQDYQLMAAWQTSNVIFVRAVLRVCQLTIFWIRKNDIITYIRICSIAVSRNLLEILFQCI